MADKYVYMIVSRDKYELPLFVCDTRQELSEYAGISPNHISAIMSHAKKLGGFCRYVKVKIGKERKKTRKKSQKSNSKMKGDECIGPKIQD